MPSFTIPIVTWPQSGGQAPQQAPPLIYRLPLELLCEIMVCLDRFHDLHSFISTSSRVLSAYFSSRKRILFSVTMNEIQPETLMEAMAIVRFPSLDGLDLPDQQRAILKHIEDYLNGRLLPRNLRTGGFEEAKALSRLNSRLRWFMEYCLFAGRNVHLEFIFPQYSYWDMRYPTAVERVTQAFFRYEFTAMAISPSLDGTANSFTSAERLLLSRLPNHETRSVWYYATILYKALPVQSDRGFTHGVRNRSKSLLGPFPSSPVSISAGLQQLDPIVRPGLQDSFAAGPPDRIPSFEKIESLLLQHSRYFNNPGSDRSSYS